MNGVKAQTMRQIILNNYNVSVSKRKKLKNGQQTEENL